MGWQNNGFSFITMKLFRSIIFVTFIVFIIHGACLSEPFNNPVRYMKSGPFEEPQVKDGDFFYLFTDHYDHVGYLSPDIPTFLSFGQWSGIRENRENIFLLLDVPMEISIHGGRFVNSISEEPKFQLINGQSYKRYRVDFNYGKTSTRSGMTQLICATKLTSGQKAKIYYATEIGGKVLHKKALQIKIVNIPKPGSPKKLFTFFDTFATSLEQYPDFKHFREIGFNRLGGFSGFEEKTLKTLVRKSASAGLEIMSWNTEEAKSTFLSGEWRAKTKDGKETDAISPTYRGRGLHGWIKRGEALVDAGVFIHVTDPERSDGEKVCFSEESLREFQAYFKQQKPDLPYISPLVFTEKRGSFPEYIQVWTDFKSEKYAGLYDYYRGKITAYMEHKGIENKLKLLIYAQPGYKRLKPSNNKSSDIQTIRTSLQDPRKLSKIFDVFSPMIYIDVNERFNHRLDMLEVSEEVKNIRTYVDRADFIIAPALSAGFPFTIFKSDIPPGNVMKYQILEAFASGTKGVGIYSEGFFDALDMKSFAEAMKQILTVEDIIAEGFPILSDDLVDLNYETFVKGIKDKNGNAVILVSEYSNDRKTAWIKYTGAKGEYSIHDLNAAVDDDTKISTVTADEPFEVTLSSERARLLLIKSKKADRNRKILQ